MSVESVDPTDVGAAGVVCELELELELGVMVGLELGANVVDSAAVDDDDDEPEQ